MYAYNWFKRDISFIEVSLQILNVHKQKLFGDVIVVGATKIVVAYRSYFFIL